MMNHPAFAFDPRILAAASAQAARHRRRGSTEEAQEVASFLLQLKHRNGNSPDSQLQDEAEHRMLLQQATHAAQLRAAALAGYPSMGAVYGLPTVDFTQSMPERPPPTLMEEPVLSDVSWELLLGDSKLVMMKDRDLVPDALFIAMAQMKSCKLAQADRVGCYKNREVGFTGMACKHCGGQPGFGRYYPNSVRSLAQTTTSQTILKHIGTKCRFCPAHIRQAVNELQRQQAAKEGTTAGRPRYGSRKIFFQRVWARLHGNKTDEFETDDDEDSRIGELETPSSSARHTPANSDGEQEEEEESDGEDENDEGSSPGQKRKNKKEDHVAKRARV
mmetsp:Transcript_103932/g.291077  ORF Transcript_103932/g.291077 Transcript_103932/m.291077 type:complete len:332 (-) Transcript_103932:202-1197(-)|eukprot:CAMPEP_0176226450 /NCGR_PEP_ID=MMETSP0121_2-20121125/22269_1 /TAXON_ID=160619 /ORGANISM="Kryptoperidinium foliaceum, Strain CCMP 1326" /LENGTH=331 /DNA_ID=CAMNT_0017565721 /DNA_START=34 /DNA_END=1029 /DNA_ORIENTATION=+